MRRALFLAVGLSFGLHAQISVRPAVQATGTATVLAPPDQATMNATVATQGTTAQDAASKNATQTNNLTAALTKLLGANGTVKNTSYWIYPLYQTSTQPNQPPTIVGYSANSTMEVTLSDLSLAGAVIDTAAANGTTGFGGISFSIKDPEPQREQALRLATQQAMAHANAMAGGSGHTVGAIRNVTEGTYVAVTPINIAGAGAGGGVAASTTITPGTIQVQATVTLIADLN